MCGVNPADAEHALDVRRRMVVAPVHFEVEGLGRPVRASSTVKISQPPGRSAADAAAANRLERAEVDERVGRHDDVECSGLALQVPDELGVRELIVHAFRLAHAPACPPTDRRPTSRRAYGASNGPHHPVPHPASRTSSCFSAGVPVSASEAATSDGALYSSRVSLASNVAAKVSNDATTNSSDGPRRHVALRTGGERVARHRIVGLRLHPLLAELDGPLAVADGVVGDRQQAPRRRVRRLDGDRLAIRHQRIVRPAGLVEHDREVAIGVGVLRIDLDRRAVRRFGLRRAAEEALQHAEVVVRVGVRGVQLDRPRERPHRPFAITRVLEQDAEVAVPVRLAAAPARGSAARARSLPRVRPSLCATMPE